MLRKLAILSLVLSASAPSAAATLTVRVVDWSGRPVKDAVVTLRPTSAAANRAGPASRFVVSQKDLQFRPFVLPVPVGSQVSFPNRDPMKHHVYSFSPAKRFELKLFAKDQSRAVTFDKPGVVALGCNIHDQMTAFIFVTDTAWTVRTDAQGVAVINDTPDAAAKLSVWHPYLRTAGNTLATNVGAGHRNHKFVVALRRPPMPMPAY